MSKYRFKTTGDFNQICRYIKDEILNTSASASLEEEDYIIGSLTVVYSLYNKKYTQNVYSIRVLSFFYCQIYENNCTNMY